MKRRNEVLVGGLLLVSLAIGILGTIWLVRGGFRSGYALYSVFRWGANLKVGQAVRLAGVQVGYVEDVQLRDDGTLLLKMAIEKERRIPRNARALVQAVGIFGDAEVGLIGTPSPQSYASGDTVPAGTPAAGIPELTAKGDSVATVAVALSRQLQAELIDSGGLREVRQALNRTNQLVAQLGLIAAEQSRQLTATQTQVRRTLASVDSATIDSTLRNVRTTSGNAAALTDSLRLTASQLNGHAGPAARRQRHGRKAAHRHPALRRRAPPGHAHRLADARLQEEPAAVHQPRDLLTGGLRGLRDCGRAARNAPGGPLTCRQLRSPQPRSPLLHLTLRQDLHWSRGHDPSHDRSAVASLEGRRAGATHGPHGARAAPLPRDRAALALAPHADRPRCTTGRTVERLQQVQSLRGMGIPLDEVKRLLDGAALSPRGACSRCTLERVRAEITRQTRIAGRLAALGAHTRTRRTSSPTDDLVAS
jgi:phospholipid/cholesterol/gamma-HCH transport system substrate-binding protein